MPTDKEIDQANDVLKQAYWDYIRQWSKEAADHVREQWCEDPHDIATRPEEIADQIIADIAQRYTMVTPRATQVLNYTDNLQAVGDVYTAEEIAERTGGGVSEMLSEIAYWAMYQDLMQNWTAYFDPDDYDPDDPDEVRQVCGSVKKKASESASSRKRRLTAL